MLVSGSLFCIWSIQPLGRIFYGNRSWELKNWAGDFIDNGNQDRAFLSTPKGSLYFVRNGAYLGATQEKEPHFAKYYIGVPASVGRRTAKTFDIGYVEKSEEFSMSQPKKNTGQRLSINIPKEKEN